MDDGLILTSQKKKSEIMYHGKLKNGVDEALKEVNQKTPLFSLSSSETSSSSLSSSSSFLLLKNWFTILKTPEENCAITYEVSRTLVYDTNCQTSFEKWKKSFQDFQALRVFVSSAIMIAALVGGILGLFGIPKEASYFTLLLLPYFLVAIACLDVKLILLRCTMFDLWFKLIFRLFLLLALGDLLFFDERMCILVVVFLYSMLGDFIDALPNQTKKYFLPCAFLGCLFCFLCCVCVWIRLIGVKRNSIVYFGTVDVGLLEQVMVKLDLTQFAIEALFYQGCALLLHPLLTSPSSECFVYLQRPIIKNDTNKKKNHAEEQEIV